MCIHVVTPRALLHMEETLLWIKTAIMDTINGTDPLMSVPPWVDHTPGSHWAALPGRASVCSASLPRVSPSLPQTTNVEDLDPKVTIWAAEIHRRSLVWQKNDLCVVAVVEKCLKRRRISSPSAETYLKAARLWSDASCSPAGWRSPALLVSPLRFEELQVVGFGSWFESFSSSFSVSPSSSTFCPAAQKNEWLRPPPPPPLCAQTPAGWEWLRTSAPSSSSSHCSTPALRRGQDLFHVTISRWNKDSGLWLKWK